MNEADNKTPPAPQTKTGLKQTLAVDAEIIEAWFREHFHDSIVSRETAVFNHIRAAVDRLKVVLGV